MSGSATKREPARRDAERSRRQILAAALEEFAEHGHAGARIDAIAERAGMSKPMIYSYFGDKDRLYAAALREAYMQIRRGELDLQLDQSSPEDAVRALVRFTLDHFRRKPWFVQMLMAENMRRGSTVRQIEDVGEIQSRLLCELDAVLQRGAVSGVFRSGVNAADLYISVAALCFFPISNQHTLRVVFGCPVDEAWLTRHAAAAEEMVLGYLRAEPGNV